MTRLQRDQEFSIPGFPGRDFAKSRDPRIFWDGISLKFQSRDFTKKSPGSLRITFSAHKFGSQFSKRFSNECETYDKVLPFAPSHVDQLQWWKIHEESLPLLAFLVRVIFPIPVASSKSERVFSVAGNVVTQNRARLAPEKVEAYVIVKSNLGLLRHMSMRSN